MINNPYGNLGVLQQQSNNLMTNLMKLGIRQDQILEMLNNPNAVNFPVNQGLSNSYVPPIQAENVKHEEPIVIKDMDVSVENELFSKMFSTYCSERPKDAKEFSIALTKYARFVQSQVDKSSV